MSQLDESKLATINELTSADRCAKAQSSDEASNRTYGIPV